MKKHILILALVLVGMFALIGTASADTDISGDFTDPKFKQIVWEWLGNPPGSTPGSFTKQDLVEQVLDGSLTLQVWGTEITSLAGLEHFESRAEASRLILSLIEGFGW